MDSSVNDRRPARRTLALVVLLLIGVLGVVYLYPSLSRWAGADRSLAYDRLRVGAATQGDLLRDVSVQGKVVAADQPTLVSPAQGVVTVLVKAGDRVSPGQVLAIVESPELQNQLQQETSILQSQRAELDRRVRSNQQVNLQNKQEIALLELRLKAAERALTRARSLRDQGLGSPIDFEKAEDDVRVAELELAHARETARIATETMEFEIETERLQQQRQQLIIDNLQRRVEELSVLSPVGGLVARIEVRDKDTVQPNQRLFSVVDLSEFEIEALIPENYGDEIVVGTPAVIHYENRDYAGEVKSLAPEVEASQIRGVVVFQEEIPTGLKQNQRVSTRLILDSKSNVVKVPRGPFLESMGGRQVYVIEGNVARLRPIRSGAVSVTEIEIVSGLQPGEQIVLSDLSRLEGAETILLRR